MKLLSRRLRALLMKSAQAQRIAPARARRRPQVEALEDRVVPTLTINPIFAANIDSDPQVRDIRATIWTAIQIYQNFLTTSNDVTVNVTFREVATGLGASTYNPIPISYASYRAALRAQPTLSPDDRTAIANLPAGPNLPAVLGGGTTIRIMPTLARALGFNTDASGNPIPAVPSATISLNMSICNVTRPGTNANNSDLQATVLHELAEVLGAGGAGSALEHPPIAIGASPGPLDLFRYTAPVGATPGTRTYGTGPGQAWFSINGGRSDIARFNQTNSGDFSDWNSTGAHTYRVQDASGGSEMPNLGVADLTALDVVGYTRRTTLPDLTLRIANDVGGATNPGTPWTWTLHVANQGTAPATFTDGQTLVLDNLPYLNMSYGKPRIINRSGVTGTINLPDIAISPPPSVNVSATLTATATGQVTIAQNGSFDIVFTATASAPGSYVDPPPNAAGLFPDPLSPTRPGNNILPGTGSVAVVDPYGAIAENYANNYGRDTVAVVVGVNFTSAPNITQGNKSNVTVSGTGDNGDSVAVTIKDSKGLTVTSASVRVSGGTWTVSGIDASALADGPIAYTATETDPHGQYQAAATATKLTASTPFYWQLTGTPPAPAVDPYKDWDGGTHNAVQHYNGTTRGGNGTANGPYTEVSSLSISASPDIAKYSDTKTYDDNPNLDSAYTVDMSWTGAPPLIIMPGQVYSIIARETSDSGGLGGSFVGSASVVSNTAGSQLNLVTSGDGPNYTATSETETQTFTAPRTDRVVNFGLFSSIIIFEEANFGNTYPEADAIVYTYQLVENSATPTVSFTSAPGIDNTNVRDVTVSGKGVNGDVVSVIISDGARKTSTATTTVSGGTWTVSGIDATELANGPVTYTVTETDPSGQTVVAMQPATKSLLAFTAAPDIADADASSAYATGTGIDPGDTISVTVTDGTNTSPAVTTTVASDGTWSVDGIDVTGLSDGPVTYSVTETDMSGNPVTVTQSATKIAGPALTITSAPNIVPANAHHVAVSGTGDDGDTIAVTIMDGLDDGIETTAPVTTTVVNGKWSVSVIDAAGLADGPITYVVTETDAAGNSTTLTQDAAKSSVVGPTVISIGPASGPAAGGTVVTITGTSLGTTSTARVNFGAGHPGIILSDNGSAITVISPPGTPGATVDVTVTVAGVPSLITRPADQFTYGSAPTIARLVFLSQPGDAAVNGWLAPIRVLVLDQFGKPLNGVTVQIGLVSLLRQPPGGFSPGSMLQATTVNGVATFSRVAVNLRGRYRLSAGAGAVSLFSGPFSVGRLGRGS